MASEWAMQEARLHWERIAKDGLPFFSLADALDAARAQGRREGLEEAAKIADERSQRQLYAESIAADIRAAIEKEPKA